MSRRHFPIRAEEAAAPKLRLVDLPTPQATVAHESWVDLVRFVAAFLIVFGHVLNLDRRFQELPVGSPHWLLIDGITAAIRWALPIFVMVSGYLLLDPKRRLDWHSYYDRRVRRLAWPLAAWTALYLAIAACDNLAAGKPVDAGVLAGSVLRGIPYYHLWYLYMLPGLYLVAPFLKLATDQMTPRQLTAAVAICFLATILSAVMDALYSARHTTYITDFPRYLGYFLAGHLLGRVLSPRRVTLTLLVLLGSIAATAALAWIVTSFLSSAQGLRVFGFGNPAVIAMSLAAFSIARHIPVSPDLGRWLMRGGEATLGIYLIHPAILDALRHWSYPNTLPAFATQIAGVFLASLIAVLAMQRTPALRRIV